MAHIPYSKYIYIYINSNSSFFKKKKKQHTLSIMLQQNIIIYSSIATLFLGTLQSTVGAD